MVKLFALVALTAFVFYTYIVQRYRGAWRRLKPHQLFSQTTWPDVQIVIPFRNEERHLPALLESLKAQEYPVENLTITLVDDHSDDRSLETCQNLPAHFRIVSLEDQQTGKKTALVVGLRTCRSEYILFTDADTTMGPSWVRSMVQAAQHHQKDMIAGPVLSATSSRGFQAYYEKELAAFMVITGGAIGAGLHGMANGANMLVRRESLEVNDPFGKDKSASGDDMFLAETFFRRNELWFQQNKEALVVTYPPATLDALIRQKERWASKNQLLQGSNMKLGLIALTVLPILILVSPLLAIMYGMKILVYGLILVALKTIVDFHLIGDGLKYRGQKTTLIDVFTDQWLHLRITLAVVINLATGKGILWKGRKV